MALTQSSPALQTYNMDPPLSRGNQNSPQSNKSDCLYSQDDIPECYYLVCSGFLIIFCVLAILVNVVMFCSVPFIRLLTPTMLINLSLAAADTVSLTFAGIILTLFSFLHRFIQLRISYCYQILLETLRIGAIITALFHLAFLSIHHYIGIFNPLNVRLKSKGVIWNILIALWVIIPSLVFVDMFVLEGLDGSIFNIGNCNPEFLQDYKFRRRYSLLFFITLVLMIFVYIRIYIKTLGNEQVERHIKVRKRNFKNSLLYLISITIFWSPAFIDFALFCKNCLLGENSDPLKIIDFIKIIIVNFLLIFKTATNIYLYAIRMNELKVGLKGLKKWLFTWKCGTRPDQTWRQHRSTLSSRDSRPSSTSSPLTERIPLEGRSRHRERGHLEITL